MTSLQNMFRSLENSVENKSKIQFNYESDFISTPALNQGANFKKYQNNINDNNIFFFHKCL